MLNSAALLLVMAAASGFILCEVLESLKYTSARENGQRLYLRSITYGIPCILITILISETLFSIPTTFSIKPLIIVDRELVPIYTYLSAPILTYLAAITYNFALPRESRIKYSEKAFLKDDFDAVLWRSMTRTHPILVSLESRKVYVGLVADGLEPSSENSYLTILPILSGYRSQETMNFEISAVYQPVVDLLAKLDTLSEEEAKDGLIPYYMAFPRSKINSLHLFNDHLYNDVSSQIAANNVST